jgi:uncharacterized protein YjdB
MTTPSQQPTMQARRSLFSTFALSYLTPLLALLAVGCGGGGHRSESASTVITAADPVTTDRGSSTTIEAAPALTLTPAGATLARGTWQQYTATVVYADGRKRDVTDTATWNVSDLSVASVTSGRVEGLAPGTAIVSAAVAGVSAAVPVTVTDAVLQSISLSPTQVAIPLLIAQPFTAIGIFSDMTEQDLTGQVTWSSSSPDVASVSATGLVHALSVGSTMIQASRNDVSASTLVQVTDATLLSVDVQPAIASVAAGFSVPFDATATFSDDSVFDVTGQAGWSSDSAAASLSGAPGVVTGVSTGSASITASFGGLSGSASLAVTAALLQTLTIGPASISTSSGLSVRLSATGSFSDGTTQDLTAFVAWSSSDTAVASVSNTVGSEGLLAAVSGGNATVTASLGGVSATAPVIVTGAAITSIEVTAASARLPAGYKLQFKAMGSFDDGSTRDVTALATWTSSDASVAGVYTSISLAGLVSGLSPGPVTIGAALGGHSGSSPLEVTGARLESIRAEPDALALAVGASRQLHATGDFDDGSSLDLTAQCSWRSLQKSIASVQKGLVTGLRAGSASILVKKGRHTDTASVDVR